MTNLEYRMGSTVTLQQQSGSDAFICQAARVSTLGTASVGTEEARGLIRYLMRKRHGSPFEHGSMTVLVRTPIFVAREFMRHRIGMSYNEWSARYSELEPAFYLPHPDRKIVQVGKAANYELVEGTPEQYELLYDAHDTVYVTAWSEYQSMLEAGIAKEVARNVLPVGIFTSFYVTFNPRSIMSFLSLRTVGLLAKFPSTPLAEIREVGEQIDYLFAEYWPITHAAFREYGSVSP